MSKVLTVINQKGGVGKSTTVQAVAAELTSRGKKVLVVELDSQGNTSFSLGATKSGASALEVMLGDERARDAIQVTKYADVIPGRKTLAAADSFLKDTGKEYKLREALDTIRDEYDYIVIDTPPVLGILTVNALTAADSVIIPVQPDIYSLQGIADLAETIAPVKKYCNPELTVEGILFTRYNSRSAFNSEVAGLAKEIAKKLKTKVFASTIREAVAIRKAQAAQKSIFDYDKRSGTAADYKAFVNELLEGENK